MKVYGASAYDIDRVVDEVSGASYDGNLALKSVNDCGNSKGPRATFTLRVIDSRAGQRGAVGRPSGTGTGPRGMARRISACWHAHWDVIEALFARFPDARLTSGFRLRGVRVEYTAATFVDVARETAHLDVGTGFAPVTMPECCECDHSLYSEQAPRVRPGLSQPRQVAPRVVVARAVPAPPQPAEDGYAQWWGSGDSGTANTRRRYLGGVPAAQPMQRPDPAVTIAKIDALLDE